MSARDDGGPAFPHKPARREPVSHSASQTIELIHPGDEPGMSLRDYFAAKAMQAIVSMRPNGVKTGDIADAYYIADMMLRARAA